MQEVSKEKIKIDFCGFWGSFNKYDNLFVKLLSKYFQVEISDCPDFIICSNRGKPFEYMRYDCVRIMIMGENMSPDFTVFDYCIGFDFLDFGDRYFRLPYSFYFDNGIPWIPERISEEKAIGIYNQKNIFCNFIYGHQSSHNIREELFRKLSEYKHVISPGKYLNNTDNSKGCTWQQKYVYLKESKFTIACDSISYPGFVTEKIVQAFENNSIPIYFGNPKIDVDFNEESFVWCKSPDDLENTIERVIYLDKHKDDYINMLMESPLPYEQYVSDIYLKLEQFLLNIFSQSKEDAYRRVKYFCANNHEEYLREYYTRYKNTPDIYRKIKDKIKKYKRS